MCDFNTWRLKPQRSGRTLPLQVQEIWDLLIPIQKNNATDPALTRRQGRDDPAGRLYRDFAVGTTMVRWVAFIDRIGISLVSVRDGGLCWDSREFIRQGKRKLHIALSRKPEVSGKK